VVLSAADSNRTIASGNRTYTKVTLPYRGCTLFEVPIPICWAVKVGRGLMIVIAFVDNCVGCVVCVKAGRRGEMGQCGFCRK
jgi:hypothetical protein